MQLCVPRRERCAASSKVVLSLLLVVAVSSLARADDRLKAAMRACGISETAMAAACVDVARIHASFEAVRQSPELGTLLVTQTAVLDAEQLLEDMRAAQDPLDGDGATAIAAAEAAVVSSRTARALAVESLMSVMLAPLPEAQRRRLLAWRAAPAGLPPEMRVKTWTDEKSRSILAALLDERLAQKQGGVISPEGVALLAAVRGDSEVASARACISDAAEIFAAFRTEIDSE